MALLGLCSRNLFVRFLYKPWVSRNMQLMYRNLLRECLGGVKPCTLSCFPYSLCHICEVTLSVLLVSCSHQLFIQKSSEVRPLWAELLSIWSMSYVKWSYQCSLWAALTSFSNKNSVKSDPAAFHFLMWSDPVSQCKSSHFEPSRFFLLSFWENSINEVICSNLVMH
jgi:hypothetical protein